MTANTRAPVPDLIKAALQRAGTPGKGAPPATAFLRGLKDREAIVFDAQAAAAVEKAFAGERGAGFELESADLIALFEARLGAVFLARVRDTGIYREGKVDRTPAEDLLTFTLYRPDAADSDRIVVETAYVAGGPDRAEFLATLAEDSLRIDLRARAFIAGEDAGLSGTTGDGEPADEGAMMTVLGWLYLLLRHHADGKKGYARVTR